MILYINQHSLLMGDTDAVVNLKREGVLYVGTVRKRWKRVLTLGLLPGMKDVYVRPDIFKMMRDKKAADKKVVNPKTEREFISCTAPE